MEILDGQAPLSLSLSLSLSLARSLSRSPPLIFLSSNYLVEESRTIPLNLLLAGGLRLL
jgi:hypothetical protein